MWVKASTCELRGDTTQLTIPFFAHRMLSGFLQLNTLFCLSTCFCSINPMPFAARYLTELIWTCMLIYCSWWETPCFRFLLPWAWLTNGLGCSAPSPLLYLHQGDTPLGCSWLAAECSKGPKAGALLGDAVLFWLEMLAWRSHTSLIKLSLNCTAA